MLSDTDSGVASLPGYTLNVQEERTLISDTLQGNPKSDYTRQGSSNWNN